MSEFNDRAFVAGSLTGIRSFKIDPLGRLTGVIHETIWLPGENVAVCRKALVLTFNYGGTVYGSMLTDPSDIYRSFMGLPPATKKQPAKAEVEAAPHSTAGLGCQCGFYAYFDEFSNPHHLDGQIHGLIEGYGVATVGHRGFRCEKAKLQALIVKPNHDRPLHRLVTRNYPDVPVFESKKAALIEFPLTPQEPAGPDSDADFWSRGAS